MPFFFGQDRKTAFVDGYKSVRSRSSVLIIKVWWTRGVHPKIKGLKWAFDLTFSSGQNDHLVRAHQVFKMSTWFQRAVFARWTLSKSMGQNDPLPSCDQVLVLSTWFHRAFFARWSLAKTMGQNDHLIFRTVKPHKIKWRISPLEIKLAIW